MTLPSKQLNVDMPLFVHEEFDALREDLRRIGSKPAKNDLVAALIHAARERVVETKEAVETFVVDELDHEQAHAAQPER